MKRYKYSGDPTWGENNITEEIILDCKTIQEHKLICLMEKKAMEIADRLNFGNYAERLVFMDAFCKGYIAAFCVNDEQEKLEQSLTPLGKALT